MCLACGELGPAGWAMRGGGPGLAPHGSSPCRSLSTGRLTDLLLKAAFGTQAPDSGSTDSLQEKPMEIGGPAGSQRGGGRAPTTRP